MRNMKTLYKYICAFALTFIVSMLFTLNCKANELDKAYTNPDTGYFILMEDDASLLSTSEKEDLISEMQVITAYGNVAFKSIDYDPYSDTGDYAYDYYAEVFGSQSGTIFLIDMDNRKIWIHSNGDIYDIVTKSYADTITDNVYTYASDADYYKCASEAYKQITRLLSGQKISQPMKYISNGLLALILGLIINFFFVGIVSHPRKASDRAVIENLYTATCSLNNPSAVFKNQTKVYSPQSDSSSGGGGGSSGGGGGGGGGGHSF